MIEWTGVGRKLRVIAGILSILGFFVWATFFYYYVSLIFPRATPDKFVVWVGIIIATVFLLVGFLLLFQGKSANSKELFVGYLLFVIWSFGLLVIPTPEGYGEAVLGGYFILLIAALALYSRYKKSKERMLQSRKS